MRYAAKTDANHAEIEFFLDCSPFKTTHHAKRIVRVGRFSRLADKPELTDAIYTYESLLLPYRPTAPLTGSISLRLCFYFPFNKTHSKKFRAINQWKDSKPDCTNLAKTFEDCLCRTGFFHDDGQVSTLEISKCYSENPGISVLLESLTDAPPPKP